MLDVDGLVEILLRRLSRDQLTAAFSDGWQVESIAPVTFAVTFSPDGVPAWLATIRRTP